MCILSLNDENGNQYVNDITKRGHQFEDVITVQVEWLLCNHVHALRDKQGALIITFYFIDDNRNQTQIKNMDAISGRHFVALYSLNDCAKRFQ